MVAARDTEAEASCGEKAALECTGETNRYLKESELLRSLVFMQAFLDRPLGG